MESEGGTSRRRTGWDVVLGIALIIGSLVVVGHVVIASAVSLLVIGWTAVIAGVVLAIGAFVGLGGGGFWATLVGGIALLAAGGLLLLEPQVGALTVTIVVGAAFLTGGVVRLVMMFSAATDRWQYAISGVASLVIGVWILANPVAATLTVLGTLLAVEMAFEGIALLVAGREHRARTQGMPPGGPPPAVAV
jgi:membrane protein HdeD